ncbi:hypothetical protein ACWGLF_12165 [Streptomyces puniciscabiei]
MPASSGRDHDLVVLRPEAAVRRNGAMRTSFGGSSTHLTIGPANSCGRSAGSHDVTRRIRSRRAERGGGVVARS